MRVIHIARSALSNWVAAASTLAVSYFMAPFLIHRLGSVEYGIWVLALSTTGYLYFLDLGFRSSLLRFVSRAHSTGNHEEASQVVSAVLWVRLQIGALTLILSAVISAFFPRLFHLPEALWLSSREALLIVGITISLNMPVSAIGAVLSALNRYDLLSYVSLLQLGIRAGGVVLVVRGGHGIATIAMCELLASLVADALLFIIARYIYPELRIRLRAPSRVTLRPLWSYGSYSFVLMVSMQLVYQADNVVVGAFISAMGVTIYSIGNSLCRYTQQLFNSLTDTFVSAASVYEASGSREKLKTLYLNGTRTTLVLCLPVLITLIIRSPSFIALWIGPQYSRLSGSVSTVLAISLLFSLLNSTASSIAIGIEKHKPVAIWTVLEAVSNLALSIVLARRVGVVGVAVGTLAPSLIVNLVLWPRYIPKLVEIRGFEIVRRIIAPIALCAIPFALASLLVNIYSHPKRMAGFLTQTLLLLPTFYLPAVAFYWDRIRRDFFPRFRQAVFGAGQ